LTIALLYFAKPAMLFRQLENFASYPEDIRQHLTILIIDDGSPDGLKATDYLDINQYDSQFRIRLARIITEKPWNIGGARNLAFTLADTQKALLLDLDVLVPMETMKTAMTWETRNQTNILAHRFNRRRPDGSTGKHPAICVLDVEAYWEIGGCDEDFCGNYGYTDVHFWYRWKADRSRLRFDHLDTYLIEFEQRACDEAYITEDQDMQKCKEARSKMKKSRELKTNHAVYKRKTNEGCWSNKYLRFRWVLEK
jgi:glycosyltransferase involved in cell wall biosynthesis